MRKSIVFGVAIGAASLFVSTAVQAATVDWTGTTNTWSNTGSWIGNVPPNAIGDVAQYSATGASVVTSQNDPAGVTVGTLRVYGTQNASWQITPNQNVFLNEDGAGPGHATVINDIQSATPGGNTSIFLNAATTGNPGGFVLQDDLWLINNSNSARNNGSIQVRGPLRGAGNIWVENVNNDIALGAISFQQSESGAGNGFVGNVTIAKGATIFSRGDIFTPSPGNFVTIGAAGKGDATLAAAVGVGNIENNFVVAANTGGTSIFASRPMTSLTSGIEASGNVNIKSTNSFAAAIRLDGDATFDNRNTIGSLFILGNPITGVGKLTKTGVGTVEITNANSYSGGTVVNSGILRVRHADAINNGFGFYVATDGTLGTSTVTINSGVVNALTPTKLQIDTLLASINVVANTATLSLAGGGNANDPDDGAVDLGAGINEVVGGLILGGVAQTAYGTYGATGSGATFINDEYFSGTGKITLSADFNVDGLVNDNDYVTWRKANGDIGAYNNWRFRANFGNTVPGAGTGGGLGNQAVPEPGTLLLAVAGSLLAWAGRRRR